MKKNSKIYIDSEVIMEYTLKYDNIQIGINSRGAEQEHLIYNGKDYMRERDEYWNRKAPVLFPIVGKLRDLKTYIDGKLYSMNQHGFARDLEFVLEKKGENYLTFLSTYSDETLKMYPFKYELRITYAITHNKVSVKYLVTNKGKDKMYFNIGGHPGFKLPMYEKEKFEDYSVIFDTVENFDAPTVNLENGTLNFDSTIPYKDIKKIKLDYKYFEIDAIVIPNIKSKKVLLVNKNKKGIAFSYNNFNTLAIWTKPNAPFVCLEPWKGYADHSDSDYNFIKKDDIVALKQNESYECGYDIEILD